MHRSKYGITVLAVVLSGNSGAPDNTERLLRDRSERPVCAVCSGFGYV